MINYSTYAVKIFIYICITKPKHFQPITFQYFCPVSIVLFCFRLIMSSAIKFNHNFCLVTIEINNILIDTFLSLKADLVIFEK